MDAVAVLAALGTDADGLTAAEAADRLARVGPNALRSHEVRPLAVLGRQLRSALLALLFVTAVLSFLVGERTDSLIIAVILAASVGLGFANEYRAGWRRRPCTRRSVTVRPCDATARRAPST